MLVLQKIIDSDDVKLDQQKRQKTLVIDSDMASETETHGTNTWYRVLQVCQM